MTQEFRPHEIVWTNDKVERIWDFAASVPEYESSYFSNVVGDLVLNHVARSIRLQGRVLDFGCGPGYLMEKLIRRGIAVEGIDFSEDSIRIVTARLSGQRLFHGARRVDRLPMAEPDGAFDVVFLIETIEHILPELLDGTLAELGRLIRKGGHVIVTTPNQEDLRANTVMCPECGCTFHRIQHVHSWSGSTLQDVMRGHGFRTLRIWETMLRRGDFFNAIFKVAFKVLGKRQPNLLYIGERV